VGASDEDNNNLLLRDLGTSTHREARFVCVVALARGERALTTVRAAVEGTILLSPRGNQGFGYDPLFFFPPLNRSFGELAAREKLAVSHRGHAIRRLIAWLQGAHLSTPSAQGGEKGASSANI
jgi:XTP/dITP diphosphohydrolase